MTPGCWMLVALGGLVLGIVTGGRRPGWWLACTSVSALAGLVTAFWILLGAGAWEWRSAWTLGGQPVHLRIDGVSAFFLVLMWVVGGVGAVYAREYWSDREHPDTAPRSRQASSAMLLTMGLVLTVSNGLHFLIAWELFALCGYVLITLERRDRAVRAAGWLYLVASHAGTVCLFAFFALLASHTGSWDLGPMRDQPALAPLFWLVLAGFGVKAGFFPLHIWLPSAHANAPSHVSAIMSAVAIKMGLYGIVRFGGWLPVPAAAAWTVMGLGATSALLGISLALAQNDYKRLLAYCSVENMGIILVGVGAAMLAVTEGDATWGRLVLVGALMHVWNHAAFKALLFFDAGSVLHATGTREMSRLGGLWRTMPWTASLFAVGALAVAGLPPLNGFVSEWLVYLGLTDAIARKSTLAWAAIPAVIMLAMAGAIALAGFAKTGAMVFLGAPRTQAAVKAHECGRTMRVAMLALAGVCLVIGLVPALVWPVVGTVVQSWQPAWRPTPVPGALVNLGWVQVGLAVLAVLGAFGLWRRIARNGRREGLTWDCGYAAPRPRMQYTSGSFAGIVTGWFRGVFRPDCQVRRPRGLFPSQARRVERMPDPVLAQVIVPTGGWILQVSTAVRTLQHGRLQLYLLYVVAALLVLGGLVFLGGVS